jgi:hypothetical protein
VGSPQCDRALADGWVCPFRSSCKVLNGSSSRLTAARETARDYQRGVCDSSGLLDVRGPFQVASLVRVHFAKQFHHWRVKDLWTGRPLGIGLPARMIALGRQGAYQPSQSIQPCKALAIQRLWTNWASLRVRTGRLRDLNWRPAPSPCRRGERARSGPIRSGHWYEPGWGGERHRPGPRPMTLRVLGWGLAFCPSLLFQLLRGVPLMISEASVQSIKSALPSSRDRLFVTAFPHM